MQKILTVIALISSLIVLYFYNVQGGFEKRKKGSDKMIKKIIKEKISQYKNEEVEEIASAILKYSGQYEVDPVLITAMIEQESSFKKYSKNSANDRGLMQVTPIALRQLKKVRPDEFQNIYDKDMFDIEKGIKAGVAYFDYCLSRVPDNYEKTKTALAYYNEGFEPSTVGYNYAESVLKKKRNIVEG